MELCYIKGEKNIVADSLSWLPCGEKCNYLDQKNYEELLKRDRTMMMSWCFFRSFNARRSTIKTDRSNCRLPTCVFGQSKSQNPITANSLWQTSQSEARSTSVFQRISESKARLEDVVSTFSVSDFDASASSSSVLSLSVRI